MWSKGDSHCFFRRAGCHGLLALLVVVSSCSTELEGDVENAARDRRSDRDLGGACREHPLHEVLAGDVAERTDREDGEPLEVIDAPDDRAGRDVDWIVISELHFPVTEQTTWHAEVNPGFVVLDDRRPKTDEAMCQP